MRVWGCFGGEPPALAGKKNGTRKSEPADELSLCFDFAP